MEPQRSAGLSIVCELQAGIPAASELYRVRSSADALGAPEEGPLPDPKPTSNVDPIRTVNAGSKMHRLGGVKMDQAR